MEAIRNDWSDKGRKGWINYKRAARLGKDISVYQLINPTPGLVAQITDVTKNTGKRSVYLQKQVSSKKPLKVRNPITNILA